MEEDLLTAMNVAEDPLVTEWSHPRSLQTAKAELEVLDQIDESERSDRDKCELILSLLHRGRPLSAIRNAANEKPVHGKKSTPSAPQENARSRATGPDVERRATLRQKLGAITMNDVAKIDRLIELERSELSRKGEAEVGVEDLMERAIGRWERENRQ